MSATDTGGSTAGEHGWRALHIHLPRSLQTRFLCEVLRPLLRDEQPGRFFYLRYWQGGPHLRLRIDARTATVESIRAALDSAMPRLSTEQAEEYAHDAARQAMLAGLEDERAVEIRPAGTVEATDYAPEYGKYGGRTGVVVAERVFCATSVAVLDLLSALTGSGSGALLGHAARIMAMSLKGSGLDAPASAEFLARYETFWRRYVPAGGDERWAELHDRTGATVRQICAAVWHDGDTDVFHDVYADALASARAEHGTAQDDPTRLRLADATYAGCLTHYVHTTNNRLGVVPATEAFVAYLLRRSLESAG